MNEKRLAHFHLLHGKLLPAEKALEDALKESPSDAETHAWLALVLHSQGVNDKAKQHAETALRLAPDLPFAHYVRSFTRLADLRTIELPLFGTILMDSQSVRKAVRDVENAIRLEPDDVDFHVRLAELQALLKRWSDVLVAADRGLRLQPGNVPAAILRSDSLNKLRRKQEGLETLVLTLEANPNDSDAHSALGWTLLRSGQDQQAREHFEEALRLDADSTWAQEGLLESARRKYTLYRWNSMWRFWSESIPRPLSDLINLALVFGGAAAAIRLTETIKPWGGGKNVELGVLALFFSAFAGWLYAPTIFGWLVRRERAGQSSLAEGQRRFQKSHLVAAGIGLVAAIFALIAEGYSRELQWGVLGLGPGLGASWITTQIPQPRIRRWAWLYSALILTAGIPVALFLEENVERMSAWGALCALLAPVFPVGYLQEWSKRAQSEADRQSAKERLDL